jgi:hypothetical protein
LAGDKLAVSALGGHLHWEFYAGKSCVAIHDIALVLKRHPALLFAVTGAFRPSEQNAFIWHCSETDIHKLINAGSGVSEIHFELTRTPPYFYVNFSDHYDEVWWSSHG